MRPKLLFSYLTASSFVEDDRRLLAERFDVRAFHFDAARARGLGIGQLWGAQAAWLRRELPGAALVYGWFADHHLALPTFAARRARVPVAVALGGFESNTLPAVGYGVMMSPWRGPLARYVLRGASLLVPCADALLAADNRFGAYPAVLRNGVRAHVSGLATPATVVPFGFDPDAWPMPPAPRPPLVLMVALIDRPRTAYVKGLDLFLRCAAAMPDVRFRAVGVTAAMAEALRADGVVPPNADLRPGEPRGALPAHYAEASVFALFSRTEGMPNVLCEAMLCGCVPVGSAVGGVPEAIGDAGFVVETPGPNELVGALRSALAAPAEARLKARRRIAERFPTALRRRRLFEALGEIVPAATAP